MRTTNTNEIKLGYLGTVTKGNLTDENIIELFKRNEPDEQKEISLEVMHRIKGKYYIFEQEGNVILYKKLPLIETDRNFIWRNGKVKEGWCKIANVRINGISFCCHYFEDIEQCKIDIRVLNSHIKTLYINNASNDRILSEIKKFRNDFIKEVTESEPVVKRWMASTTVIEA